MHNFCILSLSCRTHLGKKPFGTLKGHYMKVINVQYQGKRSWGKFVLNSRYIFGYKTIENNRKYTKNVYFCKLAQ